MTHVQHMHVHMHVHVHVHVHVQGGARACKHLAAAQPPPAIGPCTAVPVGGIVMFYSRPKPMFWEGPLRVRDALRLNYFWIRLWTLNTQHCFSGSVDASTVRDT